MGAWKWYSHDERNRGRTKYREREGWAIYLRDDNRNETMGDVAAVVKNSGKNNFNLVGLSISFVF